MNKEKENKKINNKKNRKVSLINAKKAFKNEINSYKLMLTRMSFNSTQTIMQKTIEELYLLSNYYTKSIEKIKNLEEIKEEYIRFKANINIILNNFITEYCKKYNIKVDKNKLENYWFNKLYQELEEIFNRDNELEPLLNKKKSEYQSHPDYAIIKKHIPEIKKHVIKMYYENYTNKESVLKHFDFRVAVTLKIYYERLEVINYYKSLNSTDDFVTKQIALMEENIDGNTITFKKIEIELKDYIEGKKTKTEKLETKKNIKIRKKKK